VGDGDGFTVEIGVPVSTEFVVAVALLAGIVGWRVFVLAASQAARANVSRAVVSSTTTKCFSAFLVPIAPTRIRRMFRVPTF
jgi:hypothetical protein